MSPNRRPLTFLITGCSSGLGLTLARIVLRNGHHLIATSRIPSRTPDLVKEITSLGGRWLALDVDDPASGTLIDRLERDEGTRVDVLVNNAGYVIFGPVETTTEDELKGMMETMYFGPARLTRAVLPFMRARRGGVVVNISSAAGLEARERLGGYGAAKAALDGLTKVLAKEVAPFGVRVLTVQLGGFQTNMGNAGRAGVNPVPEDYTSSVEARFISNITSGRQALDGDPEKAMQAVYEVVVGEGVGAGREAEKMLPLGRDAAARIQQVQEGYTHAMEVFRDVCNNVYVDEK